jgi:hypothetical protein
MFHLSSFKIKMQWEIRKISYLFEFIFFMHVLLLLTQKHSHTYKL